MKRLLLGTTALIGLVGFGDPARAQQVLTSQPFTININGYGTFRFGVINDKVPPNGGGVFAQKPSFRAYDFNTDNEIFFTVRGKADNGLMYGFRIELEARIRNGGFDLLRDDFLSDFFAIAKKLLFFGRKVSPTDKVLLELFALLRRQRVQRLSHIVEGG